jgi:hypothetical protein
MSYGLRTWDPSGRLVTSDLSYGFFPIDTFTVSGLATITKSYNTSVYTNLKFVYQGNQAVVSTSANSISISPASSYYITGGSAQIPMSGRVVVFATKRSALSGYGLFVTNQNNDLVIDDNYRGLFYAGSVTIPAAPSLAWNATQSSVYNSAYSASISGIPSYPFIMWEVPVANRAGSGSWQQGASLTNVEYSGNTATLGFIRGPSTPSFRAHLFCDYVPSIASVGAYGLRVWNSVGKEIFNTGGPSLKATNALQNISTSSIADLGTSYGSNRLAVRCYRNSYAGFNSTKLLTSLGGGILGGYFVFTEELFIGYDDFEGEQIFYVTPAGTFEASWAPVFANDFMAGYTTNFTSSSFDLVGPAGAVDYPSEANYNITTTQATIFVNEADIGLY